MKITLREMKKGDVDRVVDLYSKVLHSSYISYGEITEGLAISNKKFSKNIAGKFKRYIAGSPNRKNETVFLAFLDNTLLGFVCLEVKKSVAGHSECWISDLGVGKPYRRMGIAKKLIKKTKEWGKEKKVKFYFLESGCDNSNAHDLFESEGFKPLNLVYMSVANSK